MTVRLTLVRVVFVAVVIAILAIFAMNFLGGPEKQITQRIEHG